MRNRNWTQKEKLFLQEKWGLLSRSTIAKRLRRSEKAVSVMANKMELGPFYDVGEYIIFNQLLKSFGYMSNHSYRKKKWVDKYGCPVIKKQIKERAHYLIKIDDFWKWAKEHQNILDFSQFEELSFGLEPDWLKEKRDQDVVKKRKFKKCGNVWTNEDDQRLIFSVKRFKYTYSDLSKILQRTESAIRKRITDLGLKERPVIDEQKKVVS